MPHLYAKFVTPVCLKLVAIVLRMHENADISCLLLEDSF